VTKVLFYLPTVTPWWLENIVSPLIDAIKGSCGVSVMVPSFWHGTGVGRDHPAIAAHDDVDWYYLEGERFRDLRFPAGGVPEVLDRALDISADYTFCRSADTVTPEFFPGVVRYLMEYDLPLLTPLGGGENFSLCGPRLFDRGFLPPMPPEAISWLSGAAHRLLQADPCARRLYAPPPSRREYRIAAGLPADKTIVACPLEFELPENFFAFARVHRDNVAAMEAILSGMGEDCCLAVTRHPLNRRHGDDGRVQAFIAAHAPRVREVTYAEFGQTTAELIRQCDGVALEDTKTISVAALFGKPILRFSRFASADWMCVYDDVGSFFRALACGTAAAPLPKDALAWLGHALADRRLHVGNADLTWESLKSRIDRPCDPRRWQVEIGGYESRMADVFAGAIH
jgi:hypothetical protein